MAKATGLKKKRKVFYSVGNHMDNQVKVPGRGLSKKKRLGEVTPQ